MLNKVLFSLAAVFAISAANTVDAKASTATSSSTTSSSTTAAPGAGEIKAETKMEATPVAGEVKKEEKKAEATHVAGEMKKAEVAPAVAEKKEEKK